MSAVAPLIGNTPQPPMLTLRRFTVDEYHRMIEAGVFVEDERFELLEGWIIAKMTRNPPHDATIGMTSEALRSRLPAGWHVRAQCAMTTGDSELEPDVAVVRGVFRDYVGHHPGPEDLALVVEVAESSLAQDRDLKGRTYARANIPVYWLVNLVDRRIEVFTEPTGPDASPAYRRRQDYGEGASVPLIVEGRDPGPIAVADLLA
jgi:Uma2 family endonuclease